MSANNPKADKPLRRMAAPRRHLAIRTMMERAAIGEWNRRRRGQAVVHMTHKAGNNL
jgi:hypothetical protein